MLDKKDLQILDSLRQNSRKTVKEIAIEIGMPRTTVFERIRRLEAGGVIKSYTAFLDYEKLDLSTTAFVMVAYDPSKHIGQKQVAGEIAKLTGVYEVYIVSGEWDLMAKVRGKTMTSIGDLVVGKIREMPGVAKTLTFPAFYTIREQP